MKPKESKDWAKEGPIRPGSILYRLLHLVAGRVATRLNEGAMPDAVPLEDDDSKYENNDTRL